MLTAITGLLILSALGSARGLPNPSAALPQTQLSTYSCDAKDGNCNDRLGEKGSTMNDNPCYQPGHSKYDAACSTHMGVVYSEDDRHPFDRPDHHVQDLSTRDQFGPPDQGGYNGGQGGYQGPPGTNNLNNDQNNRNNNQNNNQNNNINNNQNNNQNTNQNQNGNGNANGGANGNPGISPGGRPIGGVSGSSGGFPGENRNGNQNQNQNNNANNNINNNANNNVNNNQNQNTNQNANANGNGGRFGGPPAQKGVAQEGDRDNNDVKEANEGYSIPPDGGSGDEVEKRSEEESVRKGSGARIEIMTCGTLVVIAAMMVLV